MTSTHNDSANAAATQRIICAWLLVGPILLLPWYSHASANAAELPPSLGGVSLGQTRGEVESALGQPMRVESTGDALDPALHYGDLTVWFWEHELVGQIRTTDAKHCLRQGVCPGSKIKRIELALGPPLARTADALRYAVEAEACWLEIAFKGKRSTSFEIKCQP